MQSACLRALLCCALAGSLVSAVDVRVPPDPLMDQPSMATPTQASLTLIDQLDDVWTAETAEHEDRQYLWLLGHMDQNGNSQLRRLRIHQGASDYPGVVSQLPLGTSEAHLHLAEPTLVPLDSDHVAVRHGRGLSVPSSSPGSDYRIEVHLDQGLPPSGPYDYAGLCLMHAGADATWRLAAATTRANVSVVHFVHRSVGGAWSVDETVVLPANQTIVGVFCETMPNIASAIVITQDRSSAVSGHTMHTLYRPVAGGSGPAHAVKVLTPQQQGRVDPDSWYSLYDPVHKYVHTFAWASHTPARFQPGLLLHTGVFAWLGGESFEFDPAATCQDTTVVFGVAFQTGEKTVWDAMGQRMIVSRFLDQPRRDPPLPQWAVRTATLPAAFLNCTDPRRGKARPGWTPMVSDPGLRQHTAQSREQVWLDQAAPRFFGYYPATGQLVTLAVRTSAQGEPTGQLTLRISQHSCRRYLVQYSARLQDRPMLVCNACPVPMVVNSTAYMFGDNDPGDTQERMYRKVCTGCPLGTELPERARRTTTSLGMNQCQPCRQGTYRDSPAPETYCVPCADNQWCPLATTAPYPGAALSAVHRSEISVPKRAGQAPVDVVSVVAVVALVIVLPMLLWLLFRVVIASLGATSSGELFGHHWLDQGIRRCDAYSVFRKHSSQTVFGGAWTIVALAGLAVMIAAIASEPGMAANSITLPGAGDWGDLELRGKMTFHLYNSPSHGQNCMDNHPRVEVVGQHGNEITVKDTMHEVRFDAETSECSVRFFVQSVRSVNSEVMINVTFADAYAAGLSVNLISTSATEAALVSVPSNASVALAAKDGSVYRGEMGVVWRMQILKKVVMSSINPDAQAMTDYEIVAANVLHGGSVYPAASGSTRPFLPDDDGLTPAQYRQLRASVMLSGSEFTVLDTLPSAKTIGDVVSQTAGLAFVVALAWLAGAVLIDYVSREVEFRRSHPPAAPQTIAAAAPETSGSV